MPVSKIKKYVSNAQKELFELMHASQDYRNVKGDNTKDESKKKKKFQQERGQWVGAVIQGRRYSQSGKQVTTLNRNAVKGSKNINPTYNTY